MAKWWEDYPWRMVQTNLRESDMAGLDPEKYAEGLASLGATAVTLNAGGTVASYDSALDFQGKSACAENYDLAAVIKACHERGIRVIARFDFSKIKREIYEAHPDWAYVDERGQVYETNGFVQTCLNGEYQQRRAFDILDEALGRFDFDGVFCNMSGFMVVDYDCKYRGPCHCDVCREQYRAMTGEELPAMREMAAGKAGKYMAFGGRAAAELKNRMYRHIKAIDPGLAVNGFDYARNEVNTDLGRTSWIYDASSNARLAAGPGRDRPADIASADFISFRYRHVCASPALAELRLWQSLANAGSVSHFTMGRLDNHRDGSVLGRVKKVFAFHDAHPEVWDGLTSAAEAALVYSGGAHRRGEETKGWIRALTESHIPFDELAPEKLGGLERYRAVILCDIRRFTPEQAAAIDAFAENGGTVISAAGAGLGELKCLGVTAVTGRKKLLSAMLSAEGEARFPRCAEAGFIAPGGELITAKHSGEGLLRLIPDHPYGPPERCDYGAAGEEPGVVLNSFGAGQGVSLLWGAGAFYSREGWQNTLNALRDVLFSLAGLPELAPGLPEGVELTLCRRRGALIAQLVNATGAAQGAWHEPLPVRNVRLELPGEAARARALCGGAVELRALDGKSVVTLDELREYEAIVLN